ncbi:hypothetical protein N7466_010584 [Penicillium verhagenii]|uniref:uncharacterized protein n=1 Tax=Penicillium verhagenii TaxID=1562060 RepID=UPI002545ACAF|nr:uncharacterized protein N7466_010584 [Penicillium verhagenii]KAJ5918592.1 hypothetical protein N7466_010584 [Penicillium verhagenii]
MSPSSTYSYYSTENPWDETVNLGYYYQSSGGSIFYASFAFDALTFLALVGFLAWACTIRVSSRALKSIIAALALWMISQLLYVIWEILILSDATVKNYYVIIFMLQDLFGVISTCLLFLAFYQIIHKLLNRLTDTGSPYTAVRIVHWVALGLVSALSIAEWAVYVAVNVYSVEIVSLSYRFYDRFARNYDRLYSARVIVYFIMACEIFMWTIFVTVKAGTQRFVSRTPLFSLIAASLCWFGYNLMYGVYAIVYDLMFSSGALAAEIIESVFQFVFVVGIFLGLLFCISGWYRLDENHAKAPTSVQPHDAQLQVPYPQQPYQQQGPVFHPQP